MMKRQIAVAMLAALMIGAVGAAPATQDTAPKTLRDLKAAVAKVKSGMTLTEVESHLGKASESVRRGSGTVRFWVRSEGSPGSRTRYTVECVFTSGEVLATLDEHND